MSHGCTAIGEDAAHERTGEVDSLVIERGRVRSFDLPRKGRPSAFDLFEDTMCSADIWVTGAEEQYVRSRQPGLHGEPEDREAQA